MQSLPWRGFNRLFLVLTIVWATWCAVLYPLQMQFERQQEAVSQYNKDTKACQKIFALDADMDYMTNCLKQAEVNRGNAMELWSFKHFWFYDVAFWQLEIPAIVLPPLLVYALAMIGRWVWRGFKPPASGSISA